MKLAICDDNREYLNTLEGYLEQMHDERPDYDLFESGEDLLRLYGSGRADYDAVFMDMEMGGLTGIETANRIREIDERVIIIFVTSHTKYMQECFVCEPFRFLVKPVTFQDIEKVCQEIRAKLNTYRETFVFLENRNRVRLFCDDILYFESQGHWILVHEKVRQYKMCKPLTELYAQLDHTVFCRVHKSFIVNLHYVKEITATEAILHHTDCAVPIGRTYKKDLISAFINFKERKYLI